MQKITQKSRVTATRFKKYVGICIYACNGSCIPDYSHFNAHVRTLSSHFHRKNSEHCRIFCSNKTKKSAKNNI